MIVVHMFFMCPTMSYKFIHHCSTWHHDIIMTLSWHESWLSWLSCMSQKFDEIFAFLCISCLDFGESGSDLGEVGTGGSRQGRRIFARHALRLSHRLIGDSGSRSSRRSTAFSGAGSCESCESCEVWVWWSGWRTCWSLSSLGFDFFFFRHGFLSRSKRVEGGRGEGSGRRKEAATADLGRGGSFTSSVASHALGAVGALGEHPTGPTTVAFTKASKAINSWTHRPKQFNEFWQPLHSYPVICMVEVSDGFADSKQESYSCYSMIFNFIKLWSWICGVSYQTMFSVFSERLWKTHGRALRRVGGLGEGLSFWFQFTWNPLESMISLRRAKMDQLTDPIRVPSRVWNQSWSKALGFGAQNLILDDLWWS